MKHQIPSVLPPRDSDSELSFTDGMPPHMVSPQPLQDLPIAPVGMVCVAPYPVVAKTVAELKVALAKTGS